MLDANSKEYDKGLKQTKRGFSLVWIIPIVAILITSGMMFKSYIDKGTRIYIVIDNGEGITSGKTPIMYKGIEIGVVEEIHIKTDDVSKLELTAMINKSSAKTVAREGNKFWKVEPKITITEVSGLDTLIKGVYIAVMPATTSKKELLLLPKQKHFIALDSAPVDVFQPGLHIVVNTLNKGDIAVGAPVLYKKQAIGKIEEKVLSKDKLSVNLHLKIEDKYSDLIHKKSIFYKSSAVELKASLSGVKFKMGSFASFIAGGIGVKNTQESLNSISASEYEKFKLYDDEESIDLAEDEIILQMDKAYNLTPEMSKVFCKGAEAGIVSSVEYDVQKDITNIKVKLVKKFRKLANKHAYFWIVKPTVRFNKIDGLDSIIRGNYINFISSNSNSVLKSNFILHDKKPSIKGVLVKVISDDIQSLDEGAGVFYHSMYIGELSKYYLNPNKTTFTIELIIKEQYRNLLNQSSVFYQKSGVEFKADFSKLELKTGSLETMLRGGIAVETSNFKASSKLKKQYKLYNSYIDIGKVHYLAENGLFINLKASRLGSLKEGSPIFYKQLKVGKIISFKWNKDDKTIHLQAFITPKYAQEIRENTLFYNASGIRAQIDLNGFKLDTESIETIIAGGISFYTPTYKDTKQASRDNIFVLYENKDKALENLVDIKLLSKNSCGLKVGSELKYKNVTIGNVKSINLVNQQVSINLVIESKYAYLIKKDTAFWLEKFEMNLSGVKNASSALKGPSISIKPGVSKDKSEVYYLMQKAPVPHYNEEGLRVIIEASRLGGIKAKTPLYYRQVKIGSVVQYRLKSDSTGVEIEVFVDPCFAHLIHKDSYFYNASGIGMEMNLFGAKVKTESLESILTGGMSVLTPDTNSSEATEQDTFILHEDFDKSALKWKPKLHSTNEMCQ